MTRRADIVGLDSSILMHPKVWEASGHVSGFTDPLVDCKDCKFRFRGPEEVKTKNKEQTFEKLKKQEKQQEKKKDKKDYGNPLKGVNPIDKKPTCPRCGSSHLTSSRPFNLMFKTSIGPLEKEASTIYLRPETAQGIFTNFENVLKSSRKKIPFGIAQIGKAFRNEITPGHFIFRTREFEQMEMQYFVSPELAEKSFEEWRERRWAFYKDLNFNEKSLRWHKHQNHELAHYATQAYDICYQFPFGWEELEGIHNRGHFDLLSHQEKSGKKLKYSFEDKKFIPHVVEVSSGCDRLFLALLVEMYSEERVKDTEESRVVLKFPFLLSPFQVAVLPLSKKEDLIHKALKIREDLSFHWSVDYDESGSIGKRYRRQDEIGTPFCVTLDFDSLQDQQVTVRNRDHMNQVRIPVENLKEYLHHELFNGN